MMIYKFLLSLRRLLVSFQKWNQRQDNASHSPTALTEHNRLLHRLNCITLNENEAKLMQAHLTTILEARNQDKTSAEQSDCIVLEMNEEELRKFATYVGENTTSLFRAIVQGGNDQTQVRKLRIIGNHGLRLFNVIVKSRNSKEPDQEYIYKDGTHLPILLSAALAQVRKTADINYQRLSVNSTEPHNLVPENPLHALLECIRQLMSVDTIAILLPTENGQQLGVCATIGLEEEIAEGIRIPLGCGFAGQIAASGKHMIVDDLSKIEVVSPILRHKGIRSMLGVPLLLKDQVNGVFHVGTFRYRQFTKDDIQQLQLIADRIGLAIEPLLKYGKMTSPNETQLGYVDNKHVEVTTQESVRIRVKWNTMLIKVTQLVKSLTYMYFKRQDVTA